MTVRGDINIMNCFYINLNSTFRISLSSKEHLIPPRCHLARRTGTYILYFVTEGRLSLNLNADTVILEKGDVYLFNKGDIQSAAEVSDCEYFYVHFECDIREIQMSDQEFFNTVQQKNQAFSSAQMLDYNRYDNMITVIPQKISIKDEDAFEYLVGEFKKIKLYVWNMSIEQRLELCQSVAALFVKLERLYVDSYLNSKKGGYFQNVSKTRQIVDFVDANYNKSFDSADIENRFSISYDHANRLFKKRMGMGIISYRNRLRIEKAKVLLLTTERSVESISDEVGFSDVYYFSRFFKKTVGVSPTHFKRGDNIAL